MTKLRSLGDQDLEKTVWRFMPFTKFISLVTYRALWFSKLDTLQDTYEGRMPAKIKKQLKEDDQKFKAHFDTPEFHGQIDSLVDKNEDDARALLVVSCWFLGENDSERMWLDYGRGLDEAVAIKSTIGRLAKYVLVPRGDDVSCLGLVSYVDHDNYEMSTYEARQGHERAFLKDARFSYEKEIRVVTLNVKTTSCASMEGKPYTAEEVAGKNMNNFENPGLYVGVHLDGLIKEVVVSPAAQDWFEKMVRRLVELSNIRARVSRSRSEHA